MDWELSLLVVGAWVCVCTDSALLLLRRLRRTVGNINPIKLAVSTTMTPPGVFSAATITNSTSATENITKAPPSDAMTQSKKKTPVGRDAIRSLRGKASDILLLPKLRKSE